MMSSMLRRLSIRSAAVYLGHAGRAGALAGCCLQRWRLGQGARRSGGAGPRADGPGDSANGRQLKANKSLPFEDYASFLLTYPGFPDAETLQGYAEEQLRDQFVSSERLIAFFDRYPPISELCPRALCAGIDGTAPRRCAAGRTRRLARRRDERHCRRRRSSPISAASSRMDDQDARMDALLWQRDAAGAARQITRVSPAKLGLFTARLAILQGGDGATADPAALSDPGYLYNRSRELRLEGRAREAVAMLMSRQPLASLPFDRTAWVSELLSVARLGGAACGAAHRLDDRRRLRSRGGYLGHGVQAARRLHLVDVARRHAGAVGPA